MNTWEHVFYLNISIYIGLINKTLSTKFPLTKLGQYIKLKGGYAFKSAEYKTTGIPVIRISDFQNEKIVLDNVKYYKEDDSLKKYELYEGDIIIAMTGGTIGKLAIVQSGLGKLYLNQRVGKFEVINNEDFFQEYVYWIARGVENKVKELAWGGAQPNVSSRQIENMEFSLPDKETQKKIIIFLNDLKNNSIVKNQYFDDECEKKILDLQNSGLNINILDTEIQLQQELLKKLRQSILQEAIEGKLTKEWREQNPDVESASVLLEKIKQEKEQLIKEKKIKKQKSLPPISEDEKPFEIPDSWVWCYLSDYSINRDGERIPVSQSERERRNKIYDYYGASGVIDKIDGFTHNGTFLLVGEDGANLVARSTPVAFIATGKFWVNNHAHILELFDLDSLYYMKYYINAIDLKPYITGGFQPKLSQTNLNKILLALPPLEEQKEIVKKIESLFTVCDKLEKEIQSSKKSSEQLMQAVLKEAFEK